MSENKCGKVSRSDEREIDNNVNKYLDGEKNAKECQHYEQLEEKVSMETGLAVSATMKNKKYGTILRLSSSADRKAKTKGRSRRAIPNYDELCALREIIEHFYENMEIPTVHKIITTARKDFNFQGSNARMRGILRNKLGFKFNKHYPDNNIIFERNSILVKRVEYLRPIRKNDTLGENKGPVVYVGEVDIQPTSTAPPEDSTKIDKRHVQKWIIYHAGSENGFLKGAELFYNLSSNKKRDFLQYVEKHLIPKLPKDCIVVMNNSIQHNMQVDEIPSMITTTKDIKKWMLDHNIPFEEDLLKPELLMLIKKTHPVKKYAVDELFAKHGHKIHRIPPLHIELNPLEYIWVKIKSKIAEERKKSDGAICDLIQQAIGSITAEDWNEQIDRVKKFEGRLWMRDVVKEDDYEDLLDNNGMLLRDSNSDSDTEYEYNWSSSSSEESDDDDFESDSTDIE